MAEDVAHESNFQRLTRLGFAARGSSTSSLPLW